MRRFVPSVHRPLCLWSMLFLGIFSFTSTYARPAESATRVLPAAVAGLTLQTDLADRSIPRTYRYDHTATRLADGRVLIVGGADTRGFPANVEVYDPATNVFTDTAPLQQGRAEHTATRLADGRVLIVGGSFNLNGNRSFVTTTELYDPATGTWANSGNLRAGRAAHTATLLDDGRVLVTGGNIRQPNSTAPSTLASAEVYDPATGAWSALPDMTTPRENHTATLLDDGSVLIDGGYTPEGVPTRAERDRVKGRADVRTYLPLVWR